MCNDYQSENSNTKERYHITNSSMDNFAIPINGILIDLSTPNYDSSTLKLTVRWLIVVLSILCMPTYAAPNDNEASESSVQTADNLIDYAAQKIDTFQDKDIDLTKIARETINPVERTGVQQAGNLQGDSALTGEYNKGYYPLTKLNSGLPTLSEPPNLSTPLATLEFFQSAVMNQQYDLASYALNMNLLDSNVQLSRSVELSRQFDFLLTKKDLYVFDDMPDRPDGLIEPPIGSSSSVTGIPRRSILIGYIDYRERRVPIFLQRVRVEDKAPIWVFSEQTVGNIDNLYEQYQPAQFERYLPTWLRIRFFSIAIWEFLALALFFSLAMGFGWLLSKGTEKIVSWYVGDKNYSAYVGSNDGVADLVNKLTVPLMFTISFSLVFTLVSGGFPYVDSIATATRPIIWTGLVISAVWLGIRIINFFANRYQDLQIENLGEDQFDKGRRRRTYVSIFRRMFIFVMILGSIWIGLSEFTNIDGLGQTLLTSAGIAGVVIGIAAQPSLGNIIAGMQVAITQPVRIGDTVMMDDSWCVIEDLRYTYAVLKTWDERRLIVPMRNLITEIVENWSHTDSHQTGVVYLYVDYGADIEAIRQQYIEVVKNHELWDGETEPELFTVSVSENNIKLRGSHAANSPYNAWVLASAVREKMLSYIYENQRPYLPTERFTFQDSSK